MSDSIVYTRDGALARLTLNRPQSLNAMGFEMGSRWRDLALEITADPTVGAVILDAAGPAFCAGGDVVEMATSGAGGADVTAAAHTIHAGIRAFVESDKPVVAVVEVAADPAARGEEIAQFWLAGATAAFGQAKRLVRAGARRAFADNLDDEARTIGAAFDTPDARARVTAFAAASARPSVAPAAPPSAPPAAPKETS